jgi:hypothetical protein
MKEQVKCPSVKGGSDAHLHLLIGEGFLYPPEGFFPTGESAFQLAGLDGFEDFGKLLPGLPTKRDEIMSCD